MEKYEQLMVIGEGSYGVVIKCRHKELQQIVAVKKFLETEEDATIRKMALREIRMLKRLKHENLVTIVEVFRHRKRFYLVFEYLNGTILDEMEAVDGGLGEHHCRERIFQITRAVCYCHDNQIIHRDVKPENVLVSSLGVVKLCDFGFARISSASGEPYTEYVATRWYRAPELLVGDQTYGFSVDIWAIGCLFSEMMTGDPLFPGDSDIDQLFLIVKMLGKPSSKHQQCMSKNSQLRGIIKSAAKMSMLNKMFDDWSEKSLDFLQCCLQMDPSQRLTADELLKHHLFMHDNFPKSFLPALREKVITEFNSNPLLRKFKDDILDSTDRHEELKKHNVRKMLMERNENANAGFRTRNALSDCVLKRKLSDQNSVPPSIENINEAKLQQQYSGKLTTYSGFQINQKSTVPKPKIKNVVPPKKYLLPLGNNTAELHLLEKSLESLAKLTPENLSNHQPKLIDRVSSAKLRHHQSTLESPLSLSPQQFQSLQNPSCFGDQNKSPNTSNILQPSISNIYFPTKDFTKKSPSVSLQSISFAPPNLSNAYNGKNKLGLGTHNHHQQKLQYGKGNKLDVFSSGDTSWAYSQYGVKKKENKVKADEFTLPVLPGASSSPSLIKASKKKQLIPELDFQNIVTPRDPSPASQKSPSLQNL